MVEPGLQGQGFGGIDGVCAGFTWCFKLIDQYGGIEKVLQDYGNNMKDKKPGNFNIDDIVAFVLSHGHFDHMGNIDLLAAGGYKGKCYTHAASKELTKIQLLGNISYDNWKHKNRGGDKPSLTYKQAKAFIDNQFVEGIGYGQQLNLSDNIKVTLYDAGHIIGSSQVLYEINVNGETVKILTAIDLGRSDCDVPIIREPFIDFPDDIDFAFIESTYGAHQHKNRQETREELCGYTQKLIKDNRRGIISAFSTGRTASVLSDLYWGFEQGMFPEDFRIFLDSPGAAQQIPLVKRHEDCWDDMTLAAMKGKYHIFKFPNLKIIRTKKESDALDKLTRESDAPYVIISASGMGSMGRIVKHIKSHISHDDVDYFITGYQAPGTNGWQLERGTDSLKIDGKEVPVSANVIRLRGYGAHADGKGCVKHIVDYVKPSKGVIVAHGDKKQNDWMLENLVKAFDKKNQSVPVEIARMGTTYGFNPNGLEVLTK
jgi:metallo-beta-lactamase family protein